MTINDEAHRALQTGLDRLAALPAYKITTDTVLHDALDEGTSEKSVELIDNRSGVKLARIESTLGFEDPLVIEQLTVQGKSPKAYGRIEGAEDKRWAIARPEPSGVTNLASQSVFTLKSDMVVNGESLTKYAALSPVGPQGTPITVSFVVNSTGSLKEVEIVDSLGEDQNRIAASFDEAPGEISLSAPDPSQVTQRSLDDVVAAHIMSMDSGPVIDLEF